MSQERIEKISDATSELSDDRNELSDDRSESSDDRSESSDDRSESSEESECWNVFLARSLDKQRDYLKTIDPRDKLEEFITVNIFILARSAAEEKSLFNLTHQFRNLLSYCGFAKYRPRAYLSSQAYNDIYPKEMVKGNVGYSFFHTSKIGLSYWTQNFFHMNIDNSFVLTTEKIEMWPDYSKLNSLGKTCWSPSQWNIKKQDDLKLLFDEIKKETRYDHTLGYDLLSFAVFSAACLLNLSIDVPHGLYFITVPLALLINVVIFAVVIPSTLILTVLEYLVVEPIKWVVNALRTDSFDAFLETLEELEGLESVATMQ